LTQDHTIASDRSFLARLTGRIRHGLLAQELLDRLARAGLVLYPYYVVLEDACGAQAATLDPRITMRPLGPQDGPEIARIALRELNAEGIRELMTTASCVGVFCDGQLAGYTWASLTRVPIPGGGAGQTLFDLAPDEAYLFDMYIASQYRGLRLAERLRGESYRQLAAQGRTRFYSITLAFNRSSRRFKAQLGAREVELRLQMHLHLGRLPGLDLRLQRTLKSLRSPAVRRVSPVTRKRAGD
jgi:hypothetical protein